jgi:hypothetical protein
MRTRFAVYAVIATLAIGLVAFAADALVVSDTEALEPLADDLASQNGADAILRWVDLSREPVTIERGRDADLFEEQEEAALADALADVLSAFASSDAEIVQQSVSVEGDRASVATRVRAEGALHDARLELTRNGQGWLLSRVRML